MFAALIAVRSTSRAAAVPSENGATPNTDIICTGIPRLVTGGRSAADSVVITVDQGPARDSSINTAKDTTPT